MVKKIKKSREHHKKCLSEIDNNNNSCYYRDNSNENKDEGNYITAKFISCGTLGKIDAENLPGCRVVGLSAN